MSTEEAKELAEYLHGKQCHYNHIDECGWYYSENWNDHSRKRYLNRATKLLLVLSSLNLRIETIMGILDIVFE